MKKIVVWLCLSAWWGTPAIQAQQQRPAWLGKEPLIIVGNWDSMPIFRRRIGGESVDLEHEYATQHTEETVRKLKQLGVTMAIIHFYKGFGLRAEAPQVEDARKLAALLKQNNIRVGVYVGSTLGYETFLVEQPDAAQWLVPEFLGHPVIYANQTFRKRVYFMHPGYREYMKRVLRIALQDLHADLIHFDNTSMQAQAPIFMHPLAVQDFRSYLEHRFTPEQRTVRFGYPEVQFMEPPQLDRPIGAIDDPLYQEWAEFRCEQLTAYYAEMEQFIRGLNAQAVVESNPHSGLSGRNTVWEQGVDYPRLLSHMDVVWTEEGNQARYTPEGILLSKIRTYKMAQQLNNRIFTYTGGERGGKLQMAEAMAFNRQTLGQVGDVLAGYSFPADEKPYIDFFRKHFDLFRDVRSRPDVAVLHSFASMAYNNDLPWQSAMLVEQALLQSRTAFDIIFDAQLNDLSKYRALILPDQECLSDAQMELIRRYVQSGGGLVASEQTSMLDNWRRRRRTFGLRDLFGMDAPLYRESLYTARPYPAVIPEAARSNHGVPSSEMAAAPAPAPVRHNVGRGRSTYLASIRPAIPKPLGVAMTSEYWKLPLNWEQIVEEVRWAADGVSLSVKGPLSLVAEPLEQEGTGRVLVHLLNYEVERRPSLENVEVSVKIPQGKTLRTVRLFSPDAATSPTISSKNANGMTVFTVPRIGTYTIAVLDVQ